MAALKNKNNISVLFKYAYVVVEQVQYCALSFLVLLKTEPKRQPCLTLGTDQHWSLILDQVIFYIRGRNDFRWFF